MNKRFGNADAKLEEYTYRAFAPEDRFLEDVRARTAAAGLPDIQVAPLDALHLEVLARLCGARKAVEIGTLAGYSGTAILRALGPEGVLHTFEIDPRHAEVARETFRRAGFADRAHIHVGPALERLGEIAAEAPFDLVFIDADKQGYPAYLTWAEEHLRVGGIVLGDNAFAFGHVHETAPTGEDAAAVAPLRAFAERLAHGGRFRATMIPTAEGLAFGVKVR